MASNSVDLGFFEDDFDSFELESRHFPSKIGGKPAWLDLKNLPSPKDLQCPHCSSPLTFLLQMYSSDNSTPHAFHRTIFMFLCTSSTCWSTISPPLVVLRSQLDRDNPYYPTQAPEDNSRWRADIVVGRDCPVCAVCGGRGDKMCSRCKGVSYCGEKHQKLDWKTGHKEQCKEGAVYGGSQLKWSLKEGLMEHEAEPDRIEEANDEKYKDLVEAAVGGGIDVGEAELDEIESGQVEDKTCDKFKQRVRRAPDQILRYERRGTPLLCAAKPLLSTPSKCKCGSDRSFEFQVMPQLLSEIQLGLEADGGVDWGSLYVFTCDKSCQVEGYVREEVQLLNFEMTNLPGT